MKKQISVKKTFGGILLPEGIVKMLPSIEASQLKLFVYLCAVEGKLPENTAEILGLSADEFQTALAFCRGTGFFAIEDTAVPQSKTSSVQSYDSETLSTAIREESEFSSLIKEIGRIIGKVINKNDINLLYNLYDFEGVSPEYICAVANYAVRKNKGNMAYIVRTTLSIRDEGVDSFDKLEEYITRREGNETAKSRLWSAFGFGNRTPSAKEKAYLTKWLDEYSMTPELVMTAYEITVDSTGGVKLAYMSKILDSWFETGVTTPEQAKAARTSGKKQQNSSTHNTSFDIDELYSTAVKKGMGDS